MEREITRGLVQASISGMIAPNEIVKRMTKEKGIQKLGSCGG